MVMSTSSPLSHILFELKDELKATEVVAHICSMSKVPLMESFSGMISSSSLLPPKIFWVIF